MKDNKEGKPKAFVKRHKHSEETKKKISESRLKRKNVLGYLNSPETRLKMSKSAIGKKKKPFPLAQRIKMSMSKKGEKNPMFGKSREENPNWKGGVTPIQWIIRESTDYKNWRTKVFYRDNYTCQECKDKTGRRLEAHHIVSFATILHKSKIFTMEDAKKCDELWDINNGQTLCKECHKLTDNYLCKIQKNNVQLHACATSV